MSMVLPVATRAFFLGIRVVSRLAPRKDWVRPTLLAASPCSAEVGLPRPVDLLSWRFRRTAGPDATISPRRPGERRSGRRSCRPDLGDDVVGADRADTGKESAWASR